MELSRGLADDPRAAPKLARDKSGYWPLAPGDSALAQTRNTGGEITRMLFMVIERFADNDMVPVYQRLRDQGRGLPEGIEYLDSWVEPNFARCFQLMRCEDPRRF